MPSAPPLEYSKRSQSSKFIKGVDKTVALQRIILSHVTTSQNLTDTPITDGEMLSSFNWIQTPDGIPAIAVLG
jgi:hypothetical protein